MYWIYDIQTWQLGILSVATFLGVAITGLLLSRTWIYQKFRLSNDTNEAVNGIVAGAGVLYGLLVGLVAVAAWESYAEVDNLASKEAAAVAALYMDISTLQEPEKTKLQQDMKNYLIYVIDVAWPAHHAGKGPTGNTRILSGFLGTLSDYHAKSDEQRIFLSEVFTAYNKLIEARRMRLASVDTGVPYVFWVVIIVGGILSIFLTYFFHLSSLNTHAALTGTFSIFVGLMVFLIASVDNPFRGDVGVKSDAYVSTLNSLNNMDIIKEGG
jgi:hypothetical protein